MFEKPAKTISFYSFIKLRSLSKEKVKLSSFFFYLGKITNLVYGWTGGLVVPCGETMAVQVRAYISIILLIHEFPTVGSFT